MKFWLFILFVAVCLRNWTTANHYGAIITENGTLVRVQDESTHIDLSSQEISNINYTAFNDLGVVTSLNLSHNKLESLAPSIFSTLPNLEKLFLENNNIKSFDNAFLGLNNLIYVNMSLNPVSNLKRSYFYGLPASAIIYFKADDLHNDGLKPGKFNYEWNRLDYAPPVNDDSPLPSDESLEIKICRTDAGLVESVEEWKKNDTSKKCVKMIAIDYDSILDLSGYNLKKYQRNWYQLPDNDLKTLKLYDNNITEITPELLNDLPSGFSYVDLSSNKIKIIRKNIVENTYIRIMQLDKNEITFIEDGAFENMNLTTLYIRGNLLVDLGFVKTLPLTMRRLSLSRNSFEVIPVMTFQGLKGLQELKLEECNVKTIEREAFGDLENLVKISMSHNQISELKSGVFRDLKNLEIINLSFNEIKRISQGIFSGIENPAISRIMLYHNHIDNIDEESFSHLNISFLTLEMNNIMDNSIAKSAFEASIVKDLRLNDNLISEINESFPDISGIEYLDLKRNYIKSIKKGAIKYAPNMKQLDLSQNPLKHLKNGVFHGLSFADVNVVISEVPLEYIEAGVFVAN